MNRHTFALLIAFLLLAAGSAAQLVPPSSGEPILTTGGVAVRVRTAAGIPIDEGAIVRLFGRGGLVEMVQATRNGEAEFRGVGEGNYVVEVSAPGYMTAREETMVGWANATTFVHVTLVPKSAASGQPPPSSQMAILPPKLQKELQRAREALARNDLDEAEKRINAVLKKAPLHPQAIYLSAVVFLRRNQLEPAGERLKKSIQVFPNFQPALSALGWVLLQQKDYAGAVTHIERALTLDNSQWRDYATLARAFFQLGEYAKCAVAAKRGFELAAGEAPELQLLAAQALRASGEREKAAQEVDAFLNANPASPQVPAAQALLAALREPPPAAAEARVPEAGSAEPSHEVPPPVPVQPDLAVSALRDDWIPVEVDQVRPVLMSGVSCSLDDVLQRAGRRVAELVDNMQRIGAREQVEHSTVGSDGVHKTPESRTFDYMVSILKVRGTALLVEELRNGLQGPEIFPAQIATNGLPALALIFHPLYSGDFEMTCPGLGQSGTQAAWVIDFRQREDQRSRIRGVYSAKGHFAVPLKGRAWIGANTYQILRLETDLREPIPQIGLTREHLAVDYAPVLFREKQLRLWLPQRAELHVSGRFRYRRQHTFSEFVYFSVETKQTVHDPKLPSQQDAPPEP